jgi:hypothetical protein
LLWPASACVGKRINAHLSLNLSSRSRSRKEKAEKGVNKSQSREKEQNNKKQGRETAGAKPEEQHTVQKQCDTISWKAKQNGTKH